MKQIIIVKPKSLTPKDKEKLCKNGMLVIEHEFPESVRIVSQVSDIEIDGNMLLMSAMDGLQSDYPKQKFSSELYRRMKEKEKQYCKEEVYPGNGYSDHQRNVIRWSMAYGDQKIQDKATKKGWVY